MVVYILIWVRYGRLVDMKTIVINQRWCDMPFFTCCFVLHVPRQAPLVSIPLIPSYLHILWHIWLIQKFQSFKIDLNSLLDLLNPTFEAKF